MEDISAFSDSLTLTCLFEPSLYLVLHSYCTHTYSLIELRHINACFYHHHLGLGFPQMPVLSPLIPPHHTITHPSRIHHHHHRPQQPTNYHQASASQLNGPSPRDPLALAAGPDINDHPRHHPSSLAQPGVWGPSTIHHRHRSSQQPHTTQEHAAAGDDV